jgi:hypothetical protein
LADNNLEKIPFDAFYDLINLEALFFGGNQIKNFHIAVFSELILLKSIFLSFNQLARLDNVFHRNFNLEEIYLKNNKLEWIDINFQNYSNLRVVDLRQNTEICVRCYRNKRNRTEDYSYCDYKKIHRMRKSQEIYQKCISNQTISNSSFAKKIEHCLIDLINLQALTAKSFKNCTNIDLSSIYKAIPAVDNCIFQRLSAENATHKKFDECVREEIENDFQTENFLKYCTNERNAGDRATDEIFTNCTFCRPDKISSYQFDKCSTYFSKDISGDETIELFQKKVNKYFKN